MPHAFASHAQRLARRLARWLDRIDPGTHRRIKGLRLVTAYGIAAALGALHDVTTGLPDAAPLVTLAAGFALWASVSEARTTRFASARDLVVLCIAAAAGAMVYALVSPWLAAHLRAGGEWVLISGAFFVGFLRRYGVLGTGVGSQLYIGQLLGYTSGLGPRDAMAIVAAMLIAMLSAVVPRMLTGPAEQPVPAPPLAPIVRPRFGSPEFVMGLQAATASLIVVALNSVFGLIESAWGVTACVYVVTGTAAATLERGRRRIVGTLVGVPFGLICLPLAAHVPLLIWCAASFAMIVYAMALPERYDVACGAFAFTLVVTLAVTGEHSLAVLVARAWETLLGGVLGIAAAMLMFPLREAKET
ncbi:FUSC family protein [Cupriavidus plantarum]|uniref:FUSC family protein n=1 Tax=Cupriavidus plantarum TaxID=942865 RepID=UPI0017BD879B|nr:FUSC family protein [Cupriavidus plantarum]NYI02361.1 hypothetical protein [Cupriavidus plantarum]